MSLSPPLFLRIENRGFAPIIGTCHNVLQPETVVTDWRQLSNHICFLANFDRCVHLETVVWSILKWPRGPNAMGDGKIMRIKRGNIGERAKNVRLYSALWAERGEILPNVQCQTRAFRHCVQKLYGGRHECCALAATSKQSREAW